MEENVNTQTNNANIVNKETETQNTVENNVTAGKADNVTATTSATQPSEDQTQPVKDTTSTISQNSVTTETNTASQTSSQNTSNIQEEQAAAGETKTVNTTQTTTSFTVAQIKDAASRVKSYIETNKKLPNYVTIGTIQVKMPDFLKLLTAGLLQINSGTTTPITLKTVNNATTPTESITSGNIYKTGYLDLAKRVNAYIDANSALPNYATSSLGKLRPESLIYIFSKVLNFQKTNNYLPNYVSVKSWSVVGSSSTSSGTVSTPVPAELQKYLAATANCQVTNASIKALAASITAGKTSTYDKAVAIFNWVRDKIGYSFYYNTKYGAVGTLNAKTGNCVDTSHLLIALERAAGIPARYEHVYVNGKWYYADATSSRNTFGVINNWNTATATVKGYYASLPF